MTITIPVWLLWLIGVPVGLLVLVFAVFGLAWFIALLRWRPF